jgi:hypothetical protein
MTQLLRYAGLDGRQAEAYVRGRQPASAPGLPYCSAAAGSAGAPG